MIKGFFKGIFKLSLAVLIGIGSLVGLVVVGFGIVLLTTPNPTDIKDCIVTKMYQVRLCPKESNYVALKTISPHLRNAVIVSEDSTFYQHKGFDFFEIRNSFEKNLEKGDFARGGSTITQQLAKNVYLSPEKSLLRKLREALITIQLERTLTKDEILEKYLNVVEFGENLYGIGPASRHYFKKSPSALTPAESAFLAFLLPSPKKYSVSYRKKQLTPFARSQTRLIVKRLNAFRMLSAEAQDTALAQVDYLFGGQPIFAAGDESEIAPSAEESGDPDEFIAGFEASRKKAAANAGAATTHSNEPPPPPEEAGPDEVEEGNGAANVEEMPSVIEDDEPAIEEQD